MSFFVTGGTLQSDAPSYVERSADRQLYDGLLGGEFCYVLTARQMGKSSLMVRTANRLQAAGVHVVALDLTALGGQNITPEQWYFGLLDTLGLELGLQTELEAFWQANGDLGPLHRLMKSIRQIILPRVQALVDEAGNARRTKVRLVVFVDEIDFVRSLPFSTDEFFAAIRECYNHRTIDSSYEALTFCLLGVASPSDLIRDTGMTPFNIGRRIELNDFTLEESAPLAQGLEEANVEYRNSKRLLDRILYWTGGHPYLTQRLCRATAEELRAMKASGNSRSVSPAPLVDRLCDDLFFSARARERDDNLVFVRERLLRSDVDLTGLLEVYRRVWQGKCVWDDEIDPLINLLNLSGVVRVTNRRLRERNRIYGRVFDANWVRSNLPEAELRRQRQAYRRGVVWATAVSSFVVLIMGFLVLFALREAKQQRVASAKAYLSQARTERLSDRSGQRLASLEALQEAHRYGADEKLVRREAIASLALVDIRIQKELSLPDLLEDTTAVALSDPFTSLAVGDTEGVIRMVGADDHRVISQLDPIGGPVSWIKVSQDGNLIAAQYGTGDEVGAPVKKGATPSPVDANKNAQRDQQRLIIWRVASRKSILNLAGYVLPHAFDFSQDNSKAAIGLPEGKIVVYSLVDGASVPPLALSAPPRVTRKPYCIRFDPSGNRLAESSRDSHNVQIWNLATGSSTSLYHRSSALQMSWHPDGDHLAVALENHAITLWDLRFSQSREFLQAHSGAVIDLAFSPHGDLLASLGADMTLKLWTPATGRHMTHSVETDLLGSLSFSNDGHRLCHTTARMGIQVWQVVGGEEYRVFRAPGELMSEVSGICFNPEGRVLVAANDLGASLWDTTTGRDLSFLRLPLTRSVFTHPTRGDLLVCGAFGLYRWPRQVADTSSSRILRLGPPECFELPIALAAMTTCAAGTNAATIHGDHIHLFNPESPTAISQIAMKGLFQSVRMSPDGRWLAAWSQNENRIHVLSMNSSDSPLATDVQIPSSRHFAFSPDSRYLVTCHDRMFRFWNTEVWKEEGSQIPRSRSGDPHGPLAIVQAPDRNRTTLLAVADTPSTIKLFELQNGDPRWVRELATLESPDRTPLLALVFDPDGGRLAATTTDQVIELWDLSKLREGLARLGLEDDLPATPVRSTYQLRVEFESGARDTETPQKWQQVERLTAELTTASARRPSNDLEISKLLFQRGQCFFYLRRLSEAKNDLDKALRLATEPEEIRNFLLSNGLLDTAPAVQRGGVGVAPRYMR